MRVFRQSMLQGSFLHISALKEREEKKICEKLKEVARYAFRCFCRLYVFVSVRVCVCFFVSVYTFSASLLTRLYDKNKRTSRNRPSQAE